MEIKNSLEKKFIRPKIEWNLFRTSNIWMIFILKWLETLAKVIKLRKKGDNQEFLVKEVHKEKQLVLKEDQLMLEMK